MLGGEPGVGDGTIRLPTDRRHGAGEPPAAAEVDVHVEGPRSRPGAARWPATTSGRTCSVHLLQRARAERAGREDAAQLLGQDAHRRVGAREHVGQHPVADLPTSPGVEARSGSRRRVSSSPPAATPTSSRERRNAAHRVGEERLQVGQGDVPRPAAAGSGAGQRAAAAGAAGPRAAFAPASAARSKLNGSAPASSPGDEVADVERLQRVPDQHVVAAPAARAVASRASSSSPSGTAGGRACTGVLVGAGVGDDQRLAGREHRVEQQLAVLAARVALPGQRVAGEHVVAVADAGAREDAVVETDQADHPVRHRAHRHHACTTVRVPVRKLARVGRPPSRCGQQVAHVGEAQRRAAGPVAACVGRSRAESCIRASSRSNCADLPGVARRHRRQLPAPPSRVR